MTDEKVVDLAQWRKRKRLPRFRVAHYDAATMAFKGWVDHPAVCQDCGTEDVFTPTPTCIHRFLVAGPAPE